ncbi:MAG: hypothetical protein FWE05_13065 [Defluviitaleaceae bacterium]|nr:hypothetical protein [Defluviitaleaceae bacterium]
MSQKTKESVADAFVRMSQEEQRNKNKSKLDVELAIDERQIEREVKKVINKIDATFKKYSK